MLFKVKVPDAEAMHELGIKIGRQLASGDVLVLTGELGAGKTTLTRGIGEGLGIRGPVTSPTFVLARSHPNLIGGPPLVHVDAYRLSGAAEFEDLDLDYEGSVVVVEWGKSVIQKDLTSVEITIEDEIDIEADFDPESVESERVVTIQLRGNRLEKGLTIENL